MKKLIMVLAFIFGFSYSCFSQWKIGGKVGANWSQIVNAPSDFRCTTYKPGFNAGVIGSYQFSARIALQAELMYSRRGYKLNDIVIDANGNPLSDLQITHNYIDLPVLVKFYPINTGLNIQAGVQLGFPISQSMKNGQESTNADIAEKKLDFGIIVGAAYEFNFGMFVDLRYVLGITDNYNGIKGMNNRSIQASIGYHFNL